MKVAFVSESLPPAKTGQAMVLSRLLGGWSPSDYCLLSAQAQGAEAGTLPAGTYALGQPPLLGRGYRYGLTYPREAFDVARGVRARAAEIAEVLRRERCDAVVACTGDLLDLPAACLAAGRARVPFYAYVFDHYSYREWREPARRFWAARMEPWVLKRAARVIVPNEVLRDDLRRRYRVEPAVIYNSFDLTPYAGADGDPPPGGGGGRIVYTGDIYEAHYDAFRNLLDALERPGLEALSLHAYTPRTAEELARAGVRGEKLVLHAPRSPSEIPGIQRGAEFLFLPLAFKSPYPELVRTSATTKMGEYMAARRPVLVHAPEGSFVSWYFREHGCGVVVDRDDPEALARALTSVLGDEELRRAMVERGWERVQSDFRVESAREKFMEVLAVGAAR
ncbi:MAG: glycosyltransferase [Pyrinomonadaceae bacterium]